MGDCTKKFKTFKSFKPFKSFFGAGSHKGAKNLADDIARIENRRLRIAILNSPFRSSFP